MRIRFLSRLGQKATTSVRTLATEWMLFLQFLFSYSRRHLVSFSYSFEKHKNLLVKVFLMKRGRYNRPFLHIATMLVLTLGVWIGPFLAETYPILASENPGGIAEYDAAITQQSVNVDENVFQTTISDKPRSEILTYSVQKGDTLSTIAKKFGVSEETIKWTNDMTSDSLDIGDELKILPVTGIAHKVSKGDTVYTIAKRYDTEAQKIVDFPFNDFVNPETFALIEGQIVIVPDGVKPSERPSVVRRPSIIAAGPAVISSSGYAWPLSGGISQFASWYHMALDITAPIGTPIVATQNGRVTKVNIGTWDGGYGTNIIVTDDATGISSLYAHMSSVNVSLGDPVYGGKTVVGWVGLTGRTTGAHVHFEIRRNGVNQNPLLFLR